MLKISRDLPNLKDFCNQGWNWDKWCGLITKWILYTVFVLMYFPQWLSTGNSLEIDTKCVFPFYPRSSVESLSDSVSSFYAGSFVGI